MLMHTRLLDGGPGRISRALVQNLGADGLRVRLVAGRCEPHEVELGMADAPVLRDALEWMPQLQRSIRPVADVRALVSIVRMLRRDAPRVLITTGSKAGALGRLAGFIAGVPVRIHIFHGHVFAGHFPDWQANLWIDIERRLARLTTHIVCVADGLRDEIVERYAIAPATKVESFEIGCDLSSFLALEPGERLDDSIRSELGIAADALLVLCPARIERVKNHEMLVRAAARLVARTENANGTGARVSPDHIRFVIAGDGSRRRAIEDLVAGARLQPYFHFVGFRRDIHALYRASDLVVLCSRMDAIPLSLIEATVAGVPFVATRVGGIPEFFEPSYGQLVAPDDDAALAHQLGEYLASGPPHIAQQVRTRVAERFSSERFARDIRRLIATATRS